jgi:hypothetical protein
MDMEPPLPASRRIRPTDKRLGPREEIKRPDAGYRVYVDNLHHKVTQEDIFVIIITLIFLQYGTHLDLVI